MTEREQRLAAVVQRRLDALHEAIVARDWAQTQFRFDQVRSSMSKLDGTRDRPYDPGS